MDFIQTANKQVDKFGSGKHGFAAGNPGVGLLATFLSATWCDDIQQELISVIEAAGITPLAGTRTQLLAAIRRLGTGEVFFHAKNTAPTGSLKCNGAAVSRTTYAALFAVIGTTFGVGDGSTTFNLPDLRGEFLRGWDDSRGIDAARAFGSAQAATAIARYIKTDSIAGSTSALDIDVYSQDAAGPSATGPQANYQLEAASAVNGGAAYAATITTRPRNVALLACIRF